MKETDRGRDKKEETHKHGQSAAAAAAAAALSLPCLYNSYLSIRREQAVLLSEAPVSDPT